MIYFTCPECQEELEAEDGIRGQTMNCPACWKNIPVPMAGVRAPRGGKGASKGPVRERVKLDRAGGFGFSKTLVLSVAVAALFATAALVVGLAVHRARSGVAGAKCMSCAGTGKAACGVCKGTREERCPSPECRRGKITNFRGEEEICLTCNGRTLIACRGCAGTGSYGCQACGGTGANPVTGVSK